MRRIMNDNGGYALVMVLLIITIFMMLALSFMGQSANSTKQNEITEKRAQSVALAEMGSIFYKNAIMNEFGDVTEKAEEAQNYYLSTFKSEQRTEQTLIDARNYAINEAYKLLDGKLKLIQIVT